MMSTETTSQNIVSDDGITIAIMGATGAGKSTFINIACNATLQVGEGLESCTAEVQAAPPFMLDGKYVTLIDTPGFDDTVKTEAEILRLISTFLAATYEAGRRLSGVVFLHRISDVRMGGVAKKNFRLFRKLCGDETLRSVIIATNMWGEVSQQKGEQRERELANNDLFFKPALEKGARMVRHANTVESAHAIIRQLLVQENVTLAVQREMVDEHKSVSQTSAGIDLQAELNEQMRKHKREMRAMQERMEALVREKDARHQEELKELNEAVHEVREQMSKVQSHSNQLMDERVAEKTRYEEEALEMTRAMQERENKLRDLYDFAQEQKDALMELKQSMEAVQLRAEEREQEKRAAEETLKAAYDTHKAELAAVRQEFEEKLAAVLESAGPQAGGQGKKPADGVPASGPHILPRTKSQSGPRRTPGFFSGLAVVLDQLFVPQVALS